MAGTKTADHLAETLPTISSLGSSYVVVPFADRTSGDIVRIIGKCQ